MGGKLNAFLRNTPEKMSQESVSPPWIHLRQDVSDRAPQLKRSVIRLLMEPGQILGV
jgi:hypothetical protein